MIILKLINIVLMLAIASVIILGCGNSDKAGGTSADAELITIAAFKTLLDDGADVVIVDVRVKKEYDLGHIPGAISMVYPDEIESRYKELSTDKTIVLY